MIRVFVDGTVTIDHAAVMQTVRDVVEASEHLSLDSEVDREKLIDHLVQAIVAKLESA